MSDELAVWLKNLVDVAVLEESRPLSVYAERASKAADVVHQALTHNWKKERNSDCVYLGQALITHAKTYSLALREEQSSFPNVEEYFVTVTGMLEAVQNLVLQNRTNLGNKRLVAHLKETANTILVDTGAMVVLNEFFKRHYPDPEDDGGGNEPRVG